MIKRRVLVSGSTGQQGGSVVNALLADGHEVVGITRNVDSAKAKALAARGVQMVSVDFNDRNKLVDLMKTVDTVFALTTPFEAGVEAETQQGISVANAADEAGVGHFIFNSVGDADQQTGIPHFDSKYEVEKHLSTLSMPYTIVAPVYFMDNLMFSMEGVKNENVLRLAMPGEVKLQQIAAEDIGKFVGIMVNKRDEVFGQRFNIAGDELTGNEMAEILSEKMGTSIRYEGFDPNILRKDSEDMALMFEWFIDKGYTAKLDEMESLGMMSFKNWTNKQDW